MIELCGVRKVYRDPRGREVVALAGVDLTVGDGETVCLIGRSGCGKTTALRLVNRLIEPSSGTVRVGGRDVREQDVIALRRRVGYVIQSGGLLPHLTVARNIALLCELEGWSADKRNTRVNELLDLVNLPAADFAGRYPRELSGGQRQRVGVARALALDPPYILMDEPFGALDPITRRQIQDEFLRLEEIVRKTIVIVTHDLAEAFKLGDRIALMEAGQVIQFGTEQELRSRPAGSVVSELLRGVDG